MSATVHDLLAVRERRYRPGLHFTTDAEALAYAAGAVEELRRLADTALLLDADTLRLPLAQAASILRACMDLHTEPRKDRR